MTAAFLLVVYILFTIISTGLVLWLVGTLIHLIMGDAPFVPVMDHAVTPIIGALGMDDSSVLIDIGCGNAKVLVAASRLLPQARMIGIEHGLIPSLMARWHTRNLSNVTIIRKDFFACDLSQATHLYTYLFPKIMDQLLPHIQRQVRSGTVLVSCDFTFSGKQPVKTIDIATPGAALAKKLHVYEF